MIRRLKDTQANIESIVENPIQRGYQTGFRCLDELYSIKAGSFTIWHAAPAHGKSELMFEVLMNRAEMGKISVVYSPETGNAEEIMMELAHKYLRKQIVPHNPLNPVASSVEMYDALAWVDHHFVIIDDEETGYSFEEICAFVEVYEKETGQVVENIMAEPHNELKHDMRDSGGRQDIYIEGFLTNVRRYARRTKKHVHLSFHTGQQQLMTVGKMRFYPMPRAREASGGQAGLRKAMTWINLWRPPYGLHNDKKELYAPNEVLAQIEKAKPKHVSYRGTCSLFFDTVKNRFYEKINGIDCYAYDHIKRAAELVPVVIPVAQSEIEFAPPADNDQDDDLPF